MEWPLVMLAASLAMTAAARDDSPDAAPILASADRALPSSFLDRLRPERPPSSTFAEPRADGDAPDPSPFDRPWDELIRERLDLAGRLDEGGLHAEAEAELHAALATIAREGLGPMAEAGVRLRLAGIRRNLRDLDAARREADAALDRARAALGADAAALAEFLGLRARIAVDDARLDDAEADLRLARRLVLREDGPYAFRAAWYAAALGEVAHLRGRLVEAEVLIRAALDRLDESVADDDPELVPILGRLASVLVDEDRADEAVPHARRALAIAERRHGATHPGTAWTLALVAMAEARAGNLPDAEADARRALAIAEHDPRRDPARIASYLVPLACIVDARGRPDEADRQLVRAVALAETGLGAGHPEIASMQILQSRLRARSGRAAEAAPPLDHALTILRAQFGPDAPAVRDLEVERTALNVPVTVEPAPAPVPVVVAPVPAPVPVVVAPAPVPVARPAPVLVRPVRRGWFPFRRGVRWVVVSPR